MVLKHRKLSLPQWHFAFNEPRESALLVYFRAHFLELLNTQALNYPLQKSGSQEDIQQSACELLIIIFGLVFNNDEISRVRLKSQMAGAWSTI
jgi:hypothetical protein